MEKYQLNAVKLLFSLNLIITCTVKVCCTVVCAGVIVMCRISIVYLHTYMSVHVFCCPGTAYIHGMKHATGNFVIIMDADLSHHVSSDTYQMIPLH